MITFVGDQICKLDAKGRLMLPSAFVKQMGGAIVEKFVIKKDVFESCLVFYPQDEWDRQVNALRKKLNPYKNSSIPPQLELHAPLSLWDHHFS